MEEGADFRQYNVDTGFLAVKLRRDFGCSLEELWRTPTNTLRGITIVAVGLNQQ
jgi:hypothetical protein